MGIPSIKATDENSLQPETAEEICKKLEDTILKYLPQIEHVSDRRQISSVPLVPPRYERQPA
jgi:hypothetical protein